MQNKTSHVPFAQLPVEARALFFIYASAALARYRSQPPTTRVAPELEVAWNINQLSQSDLSDPNRMTHLLEQHFAPTGSGLTGIADASLRSRRRGRKASR